ncbi:hypothetical protein GCM10022237_03490 [Nocardioides ginsengisoli]|uniref:Uncharacterized protein n=1 Tax=Nocardioides ginsengisoli TaxID=363868 RepID=A0ABW3VY51_9ACTN
MSGADAGWQGRRFAMTVLGGVVVSLALLAVLLATATTPGQARAQRAIPDLPPPTMAVTGGSRAGVLALPRGAIATDGDGRTWVRVWTGRRSHRVQVHEVRSDLPQLAEVTGDGLRAGDLVELVAPDEADAPPRIGA